MTLKIIWSLGTLKSSVLYPHICHSRTNTLTYPYVQNTQQHPNSVTLHLSLRHSRCSLCFILSLYPPIFTSCAQSPLLYSHIPPLLSLPTWPFSFSSVIFPIEPENCCFIVLLVLPNKERNGLDHLQAGRRGVGFLGRVLVSTQPLFNAWRKACHS